jgi:HK97 family phage portal protein
MALRQLVARVGRSIVKAAEGQSRPGPWLLPVSGGWLPANVGSSINWWQNGHDIERMAPSAMVEACIAAYSQTSAMCPGDHWLTEEDEGGRERVDTSDLARILRNPNSYQSISDFMLNAVRSLYADGNTYALALRNNRYEVDSLHLMDPQQSRPYIAEDGSVFFELGGNPVIDKAIPDMDLVPARDVLHIKMNQEKYGLRGLSPLLAIMRDMTLTDAIASQQINFYLNQARPSHILTTDLRLDKDQVEVLRQKWDEQSRGVGIGGTPILSSGLKPVQISTNSIDSQLADTMKMTDQRIALAYRIPLQMFGLGGGQVGSTEALMQMWIATGLGFCLNHVEEAIGTFFKLDGVPYEYLEFDTSVLLRSAFKDRVDAYVRSVQGAIHSPNEARAAFDMEPVDFGDEPRVQQQVVPLSAAGKIPATPAPGAPPAQPGAAGPPGASPPDVPAPPDEPKGITDAERTKLVSIFRTSHARQLAV